MDDAQEAERQLGRSQALAERQAASIWAHYDVPAIAVDRGVIYIAASQWAKLHALVMADDRVGPVGRGWYLNGNRNVVVVPECDRCGLELWMHGDTLAGQACDLNAAFDDLWRAIFGRFWWRFYVRANVR